MKTKLCILMVCLFAIAGLALAQAKVDGKWTAEIQGARGAQMVTITLKNDGGKLTGTVEGGRGGAIPIEEGSVSGNTIKFKQKQMGRGGEIILNYTGTSWATRSSSLVWQRAAKACLRSLRRKDLSKSILAVAACEASCTDAATDHIIAINRFTTRKNLIVSGK